MAKGDRQANSDYREARLIKKVCICFKLVKPGQIWTRKKKTNSHDVRIFLSL